MATGTYVTPEGLLVPTIEDLLLVISTKQKADIDPLLNTEPDGPLGQLNGIFASHLREAWEVLAIAFDGSNPDAAEGALLENVSAITGTLRAPATRSVFSGTRKLTVNLDANKTVPVGTVFAVLDAEDIRFATTEEVSSTIAGDYLVSAEAEELGPVIANAGTLTVIATPVVGLNTVTNDFDATIGQPEDSDLVLRLRRERELRATGAGTIDSIRADLLSITIDGNKVVLDALVVQNVNDYFDNDLPPHSIACLVYDGVAQDAPNDTIAQVIWDSAPAGIQVTGLLSGLAKERTPEGLLGTKTHTVKFSRPVIKEVKFTFTLTIDPATYAGDTKAKEAVDAKFQIKVRPGKIIYAKDYVSALLGVPGVVDITNLQMGFVGGAYSPNLENINLTKLQMATTQITDMVAITNEEVDDN